MIPAGRKVAVVLSGCGHLDGSDITETVSMIVHLSKCKAEAVYFTPQHGGYQAINHVLKRLDTRSCVRNTLDEANRIANVSPLEFLRPAAFDVLMFPGGDGVLENLSNFGKRGVDGVTHGGTLECDVRKALVDFHAARKPIGVAGTAPILVAKAIKGATITFGALTQGHKTADLARSFGAVVVAGGRTEVVVDPVHRVASTAAYMFEDATPADIFDAVGALVEKTLLL